MYYWDSLLGKIALFSFFLHPQDYHSIEYDCRSVIYCGAGSIRLYRQDSPMEHRSCWEAGLQEQRNQGEEKDPNPLFPLSTFINSSSLQYRPSLSSYHSNDTLFCFSFILCLTNRQGSVSFWIKLIYSDGYLFKLINCLNMKKRTKVSECISVKIDKISDIHMN